MSQVRVLFGEPLQGYLQMLKSIILFFIVVYSYGINLAVSTNVSYAMNYLVNEFEKNHPNIKVNIILGSSGNLTAQIRKNAPYDIFLSANMKYPNALYEEGFAVQKPIVYAKGKLAIVSKRDRMRRVAIANPKTAPYGKAAMEVIKKLRKRPQIIYAQTVSQVLNYVMASAVDAGYVSLSASYSPKIKKYNLHWKVVDKNLYSPINQGIVILKYGANKNDVKTLYNFILKRKDIFVKFGYDVL